LLNLSGRQNEDGEPAAADASFRTALRMVQDLKFPDLETCAWQMHSDDLLLRGDRDGARQAGEEALRIARSLANSSRIYRALVSLGSAETAGGAAAAARGHFDEAAGIADTIRAQSPGEASDLGRAYANLNPLYRASVRNLLDLKLPDEAFRRAEEAKARVLMNLLVRGGVDERASMTSAEVAEQTVLRKRLGTANALVEYRQFRRTLYENHPELALRSADFEAANLSELVALLPDSKTALLDYFFVSGGVALFVIRENSATDRTPRIATHLIPDPQHTLEAEARRYREMLASRDAGYKSVARRLYNRLIAPAAADLAGTTGWIVSPDGALWDVPFEALVDSEGRHVIETRTVTLAPSLTAALTIHQRSHPASADSVALLALGNPLPAAVPLPDAAREAAEIGAGFPRGSAVILTGRSATAKAFADRAGSAGIVHLAAHASLNDIDPLSSSVRLGTEEISALDLMSFHLRADLVVLSACETARGGTGGGEGAMGMGWALAAAGASSSVLSLWKIDSAASREFMTAFYRNLASKGKAGALRQAGLEMLRAPAYRHPFYWAAFTLQGDSGMAITPAAQ
jgi:CHAT domain-containing protein